MAISKKLRESSTKLVEDDEIIQEEFEGGAEVLMSHGFPLLLLNMVYGLLPITISGNRLRHTYCSISTVYSVALMIATIFFTTLFIGVSAETFGFGSSGIADIIAIGILTGAHVIGFMVLAVRGHKVAKCLPKIWNSTAKCFQISVIDIHGKNWKPIKKMRKFCIRNCIIYIGICAAFSISKSMSSMGIVLALFNKKVFLRTEIYGYGVYTGYILWDLISLGHILVSLLVNFFLLIIIMCLRSANGQLRDAIAIEVEVDGTGSAPAPAHRETAIELHLTREFQRITKIYSICESVTNEMSKTFGIGLIVEVLVLLGNTLCNLYLLIRINMDGTPFNPYDQFELWAACFYNFFFTFQASCSVSKMINESRKPINLLEGIQYKYNSPRLKEKIQSFKSDISNTRITLSASDYFQLDKRMISALVGAVTTYLIVMLQFLTQHKPGS